MGTLISIELALAFLGLGFMVGIPLAVGQVYGNKLVKNIVVLPIVEFFRSIPALVLLFLFYFGASFLQLNFSPFIAALLAMGFRSAAYQSQIFRGAIKSIDVGQMQAARSLGMTKLKAIRYIILPQALRLSIPSWSNEYASVLKDTSLVYALGITELMRQGRYIVARTFGNAILVYIICALIYFVIVHLGVKFLNFLEEKYKIPGYEIKKGTTIA
ncbi:MAG: amino acid ABC transporter permease [Candidatus Atribacteria bacterium]|nr:amino acid ABC transporter permease [Candidatus Atribacteria bacterium]